MQFKATLMSRAILIFEAKTQAPKRKDVTAGGLLFRKQLQGHGLQAQLNRRHAKRP